MKKRVAFAVLAGLCWTGIALAVPDTVGLRVTDVTPSSFALVWMTDPGATPALELYGDSAMTNPLGDGISVLAMPDAPAEVAAAARAKGIMKIRVAGLAANSRYYVRSKTADPADPASIGYSGLQEVSTAAAVVPFRSAEDGSLQGVSNDLLTMRVYIRPSDQDAAPGRGDLVLLQTPGSPYPVSAFVGAGITAPEGVVDLNNLFSADLVSLSVEGGEKAVLTVYRGGILATLAHYRRLPAAGNAVSVAQPVKGFFADLDLDGRVDEQDFDQFRKQYRSAPDDAVYNPDYNFVEDAGGRIDAQDFTRFARQYGRVGVE